MRDHLAQTRAELVAQQPGDGEELVHFTESLAGAVIEELSEPGDLVLDPFAGFGTTLVVARRLGRRAVGLELLAERVQHVHRRLPGAAVMRADARTLSRLGLPPVDLCLTSPPYMAREDRPHDPLDAYRSRGAGYDHYLHELDGVFAQVAAGLRPGGYAAINVADTVQGREITPLADDLATALSAHLTFVRDVELRWDEAPWGIADDHLLVFRRE